MTGMEYYERTGSRDMLIPTILKTLNLPPDTFKIMYFDDADLVFNEKTVANLRDTIGDMATQTKSFMDKNPKYVARSMRNL
jgi:hypothetical protein